MVKTFDFISQFVWKADSMNLIAALQPSNSCADFRDFTNPRVGKSILCINPILGVISIRSVKIILDIARLVFAKVIIGILSRFLYDVLCVIEESCSVFFIHVEIKDFEKTPV